jgi:hypothetical protein
VSIPVTFERTDGTAISSRIDLQEISHMEHFFAAVKVAA